MNTRDRIASFGASPRERIVNMAIVAGGIYLAYRVGKRIIGDINKNATQVLADDSAEVRQAMNLRNAMNPSGISWLISADGTNEQLILDTARQITRLDEVSKAYKNLYQSNLLDDLQRELSAGDYSKFLTLVSANPSKDQRKASSAPPVVFAPKASLVVAKKPVSLRSSPDATNHGAFYEVLSKKNIIRSAKQGEFLGYATGKQHFDEKNNVKFIEVGYTVHGGFAPPSQQGNDRKKVFFWVSSSSNYVELFDEKTRLLQRYPDQERSTKWMVAPDFFETKDKSVKGTDTALVITTTEAYVLGDGFRPIARVSSRTLLGHLVMVLDTGRGRMVKFLSADQTHRWVDARYIKIVEQ